ncbi:hypothetical protein [Actinomadura kijaniata]|uniref:hypothetical protein n=1 Tax=Actinomadura kijaniata TaxID=46161 RepID=UPI0008332C98|nr:hypothetical protein [Actinomadura kijaniata]
MTRFARRARVTGAVALMASGVAVWPASAAETPRWRVFQTHRYDDTSSYHAVAASGKDNAWVFGETHPNDGRTRPIARRWTGRTWRDVPMPAELRLPAHAGSTTSPSNTWALVGMPDGGPTYALRWDGREWSVSNKWNDGLASDMVTFGPRDVWVLGYSRAGAGIGTWHFDGGTWKRANVGKLLPHRLSAVSAKDIWAVGAKQNTGCGDRTIAHFNGTAWKEVRVGKVLPPDIPQPETGGSYQCVFLRDVAALSKKDVWVTGEVLRSDGEKDTYESLLLRWDGRKWRRVNMPNGRTPERMVSDGRGGLWFIGGESANDPEGAGTPLLHRTASGVWSTTRIDTRGRTARVSDLILIPRTRSLWGAGRVDTSDTYDATVYRLG